MASSTPIYKAYVGIIPTAKGFGKNLEGELSNANLQGAANRVGDRAGRTLGSRLTSAFKGALKIGGVITAAVGAAAVGGGISRQLNIEDAQKKLQALGHDTKNIETIMNSALDSVKGTAYGLDSAATQAAGAVAAGIKPGKELTSYLKLTADAATIAGVSMDEMGFVMNKVQTGQQAYTEDLNMLADRGIPIFQWLQDEYGVTAEELKKMVSNGEVDAQTYFKVIEENIGGAALKSGETTRGAFKNMLAALSRVGVALTSGFFPLIREGFVGATAVLDAITPKLEEVFSPMWEILQPLFSSAISEMSGGLSDWITNLDVSGIANFFEEGARGVLAFVEAWKANDGTVTSSGFPGFMERLANISRGVWDELKGGIEAFGAAWEANDGTVTSSGFPGFMEQAAYWIRQVVDAFKNADYSGFKAFFDSLSGIKIPDLSGVADAGSSALGSIGESLGKVLEASPGILAGLLEILADALGFLGNNMDVIGPLLLPLVAAFIAWKAASQAQASAQLAVNAAQLKALPLTATNTSLTLANTLAVRRMTPAQLQAMGATQSRTAATTASSVATARATIAEKARTVATKLGTVASKAAAIATRMFGAALRFATGPIGLIIIAVTALVAGLIWFFTKTETGQKIWEKVWTAIKNAAGAVADWFMNTVVPLLLSAWDAVVEGALWLYDNVILKVWEGIKIAINIVVTAVMGYVQMLVFYWQNVLVPVALWLYNNIIKPVWEGIKIAIAVVVTAVIVYVQLLVWYWQNVIAPVAKWLYNTIILPVWEAIKNAIKVTIDWFVNTGWPMLKQAWDAVASAAQWLYESVILPVWNAIKAAIDAVVKWFQNTAWPLIDKVIGWLKMSFEGWKIIAKAVWDAVKSAIKAVVDWFQNTAKPIIDRVVDAIKTKFDNFKNNLKRVWDFIKNNVITPVVTWFRDTVKPIFDKVLDTIETAFENAKDNIGTIWDKLKNKVKKPIEIVVNKVSKHVADTYDKLAGVVGAKKINLKTTAFDFWTGGMLPGYTPGKDIFGFVDPVNGIRLNLSGGEPIMRPEFGRVMGKGWIDSVNAAARSGGVGGVKKALGFATGGVFPGGEYSAAGGAWDWVKKKASGAKDWLEDAWETLTDFIEDPKKAFNAVKDGLLSTANIPDSGWGELLRNTVTKVTDGVIDKVLKTESGVDSEGTGTVAGAPPQRGARLTSLSQILGLPRFGNRVTSTVRRGARTAGSGSRSLHALGKAADFAGSTSAMRTFFNYVRNNYRASELIHTPMGGRQLSRGGRPRARFRPVTARMHYNHVHVGAFKDGGMFGGTGARLMDQGGYLMPGVNHILNKTGGYETVIPRAESEMLRAMSAEWKSGGNEKISYVYSPNQVDMDDQVERRTRREFETFVDLAKKASR